MNTHAKLYTALGLILFVLFLGVVYLYPRTAPAPVAGGTTFECLQGNIKATFTDNTVILALSDGRMVTLPQVQSGSGIRYAEGTTEFMSKGSWAQLSENGTTTYAECVVNAAVGETSDGEKVFSDSGKAFHFMYPADLQVTVPGPGYTQEWATQSTGLGVILARVTLTDAFEPKTNFRDARFTVGVSDDAQAVASCNTAPEGVTSETVVIHDATFTKFTVADAGAGNLYETTAYRAWRAHTCYSIEYTIHTTNLGNYSPDQGITAYDKQKVLDVLEGMVQSFTFLN